MHNLLIMVIAVTLVASGNACRAQEPPMAQLTIDPEDFADLHGCRLVDAATAPSGKAILIEQPDGHGRAQLILGERGDVPTGLYYVKVLLGSDDGSLKWSKVQVWLDGAEGGWFTGFVRPGEAGQMTWREISQPMPLENSGELVVEVCARGDSNFYIGQVVLERTAPYWPEEMITDAEFFGGLDRSWPGLEKVIAAADARDYDTACSELVAYLRANSRSAAGVFGGALASEPPPPTDAEPPEIANLLLDDKMVLEWDYGQDKPGAGNDYCTAERSKIPPTVYSFADPHEWHKLYDYPGRRWYGFFISANLRNLATAYQTTGDARFARKAVDLVERFVEIWGPFPKAFCYEGGYPNEYYTRGSAGQTSTAHTWGKCSGIRSGLVEALWTVLKTTGGCEQISDRERIETLKLALLMTRYVQNVRAYANGVHPKNVWLLRAGDWMPEFPEVRDMSQNGLYALHSFLDYCHYPDGAYFELCYYRHGLFAEAAQIAATRGLDVSGYLDTFRPTFDLNLWLTHPMGDFPWINDHGQGEKVDRDEPMSPQYATMALRSYPDDPHLKYIHSHGAEGEPPQPTSRDFDWCGFMVMRSGWRPDDLHLIFDGGRSTGSHQHQDQMNIVVAAYRSTLLCDNGYVGTGFSAPDRAHYISHPRGHNLVMVDDLKQTPNYPPGEYLEGWRRWGNEPLQNYWVSVEGFDYAETAYDRPYAAFDPQESRWDRVTVASQQRRVLFLKPGTGTPYWVLYDIVEPKADPAEQHSLQLLFHFTPTSSGQIVEGGRAVRNTAENAGLLILPRSDRQWNARIVRGEARPEEYYWQGFVSGGAHQPLVPNDCAIFEHDGPLPAGVATVLYPYPLDGHQAISAELLSASRGGTTLYAEYAAGLEVTLHDGSDNVLLSAEPGTITDFGDLATDARAAVVRRDLAGSITSLLLVEGTTLRSGDQVLLDTGGRIARYLECGVGGLVTGENVNVGARRLAVTGVEWMQE